MAAAIQAEKLSKSYRINPRAMGRYRTLRETVQQLLLAPWSRQPAQPSSLLWALRDVSFTIQPGEVVGIIGRNGAGKSTLLKVLSRITEPTSGCALLRGRVGSLLEVGTGFHLELTGRENIFLNGAILGMTRREVLRRFDEIVAFAEIEPFLDTPVKRYSSGMYMRLAFAVAANLDPDILLVDEVLAVGDLAFQRKCLRKLQEVGTSGRTVLMIAHDLSAVSRLCRRTIMLEQSQLIHDGPTEEVIHSYLHSGLGLSAERRWTAENRPGNEVVRLDHVRVCSAEGTTLGALDIRRPLRIEIEYEVIQSGHIFTPHYHFFTSQGIFAFVAQDNDPHWRRHPRPPGHYRSSVEIPGNFLGEGTMLVSVALVTFLPHTLVHLHVRDAVAFEVIDSMEGNTARGDRIGPMPGVVRPIFPHQTEYLPPALHSAA